MPMQPDRSADGSLSVVGIADLAGIIAQCRIDIHQQGLTDDNRHRTLYQSRLSGWEAVPLWAEHWVAGDRQGIDLYLSEGEMQCAQQRFTQPQRQGRAHLLVASAPASHKLVVSRERCTLGSLLNHPKGLWALNARLDKRCVAPYSAADVAGLDHAQARQIWCWDNGDNPPTTLICLPMANLSDAPTDPFTLWLPTAWGALHGSWYGQLHLHSGQVLVVCDHHGRYGLIRLTQLATTPPRVIGHWLQPCSWQWLAEAGSCGAQVIEAARTVEPDARGELVCDLLDLADGRLINPPGVKGLLGTSGYSGTGYNGSLVVNEAGHGPHPRVLGLLSRQGELLRGQPAAQGGAPRLPWQVGDLHWLETARESEGLRAVRAAESGQWGYIDSTGTLVIAPCYGAAGEFSDGTAVVQPADGKQLGLIDKAGRWLLPPVWQGLWHQGRNLLVALTGDGQWGAIDSQGRERVAFAPTAEWLRLPSLIALRADGAAEPDIGDQQLQLAMREAIDSYWQQQVGERVCAAVHAAQQSGETLGAIAGLLDGDSRERDLRRWGLWGLQPSFRT